MWKPIPIENQWGVALSDGFAFKDYNNKPLLFLREGDAQNFCDTRNAIDDYQEPKKPDYWETLKESQDIMEQTNNYFYKSNLI